MLDWRADEQRRRERVMAQVEQTLAQPMVQATKKETFKRGERTTNTTKREWSNWDVDLSVVPDKVHKVDGYFMRAETDTIHHIPSVPTKAKKAAKKSTKKASEKICPTITTITIPTNTKATLRIVDGKRVWRYNA